MDLRKRIGKCFIWSVALYGSEIWTLKRNDKKISERVWNEEKYRGCLLYVRTISNIFLVKKNNFSCRQFALYGCTVSYVQADNFFSKIEILFEPLQGLFLTTIFSRRSKVHPRNEDDGQKDVI